MSLFTAFYRELSEIDNVVIVSTKKQRSSRPVVPSHVELLDSTDPFAAVAKQDRGENAATYTIFTRDTVVVNALPHLSALPARTVVNIELSSGDYQNIVALKDLGFTTTISKTHDDLINSLFLSHILVKTSKTPILNFIEKNLFDDSSADVRLLKNMKYLLEHELSLDQEPLQEAIQLMNSKGLHVSQFEYTNGSGNVAFVSFGPYASQISHEKKPVVDIKILPLPVSKILDSLPSSIDSIAILESSKSRTFHRFSPLLLEFFQEPNLLVDHNISKITTSSIGHFNKAFSDLLKLVISNLALDNPIQNIYYGEEDESNGDFKVDNTKIHALESSYTTILDQLFGTNLNILNEFNSQNISFNSPEFGFGAFLYRNSKYQELISLVHDSLDQFNENPKLTELLSKWLIFARESKIDNSLNDEILENLTDSKFDDYKDFFHFKSSWLIGSDAWSYDLGSSGVHQVLASNENVNLLIIDNETYDSKLDATTFKHDRKKDIGLYAMNYGNCYVGSVAVYSSYTQVLTTLIEASKFDGPSIVLAYLPIKDENDSHLNVLTNTKKAVETGHFPLYRYSPDGFKLDSTVLKENLKNFLDRENKLTLLSKNPQFRRDNKQEVKAKEAFNQLLEGLSGPPLSIYFASDGGGAESLAKKLNKKALQKGLKSVVQSMDDIEDLTVQENIVFLTSTSGQGEFPQNGKAFWDSIKNSGDLDLEFSKISVFGMGDSEYWPGQIQYYNKPAKDLFNRLLFLNAKELCPLGLGDDQDADGYQTGYKPWEESLWKALGVDDVQTVEEVPITNEDIKIDSDYLRGTIAEGLKDESTGAISAHDQQLTKFHGIYMQDDRDLRDARKAAGLEPFYIFMARVRLPGGNTTPDQWLALDKLADERGNGTMKITTRATFQLHGIVKHNLKSAIRGMNSVLMDTLGACGDVNRNVMISALPGNAKIHKQVGDVATVISEHLLPQTTAYHEIWLKGSDPEDDDEKWPTIFEQRKDGPKKVKTLVAGNSLVDNEPFYGPTYLPRKYKINIAVPPYNDVDVWSSDVGLIAIIENNELVGFNVLVGGGMGSTHNNKKTYPRAGSSFGFISKDKIHVVCEKIMLVQRDHGNRKDRKNARLKYTVDTLGVDVYKAKVEELLDFKFEEERPYEIKDNIDHFGWVTDELHYHHFTCFIENGRVENTPELPQKLGFKKIAEYLKTQPNSKGVFRLTGNQHVLISQISDAELPTVKRLMAEYKLDNTDFSGLRLSSAACVAFPTCGLAMAESERYLPILVGKLEEALEEYGLRHDSIVMRMTGCPNGCARPWLAEIALVGKAYGVYNLMLGGGYHGQRVNKIYRQNIKEEEALNILKPLFKRWALERQEGEHFGDFCIRIGIIKPTLEGKYFHDDIPEQ